MLACIVMAFALSVVASTPADSGVVEEFLNGRLRVVIPAGYERSQNADSKAGVLFVRKGDWAAALAKALPNKKYDDLFLKAWFGDDVRDYVKITAVALTDPNDIQASPRQIHGRFARGFTSRWGAYSFSTFDDETGIGRCVNYAGAFVFVATRKLDDTLIVVEAMDKVEALVAEGQSPEDNTQVTTEETLWKYFERAANNETVTMILKSAQLAK